MGCAVRGIASGCRSPLGQRIRPLHSEPAGVTAGPLLSASHVISGKSAMKQIADSLKDSMFATLSGQSGAMSPWASRGQSEAMSLKDTFKRQRTELDDFSSFLEAVTSFADMVLQATTLLEKAPQQLLQHARTLHGCDKVEHLDQLLSGFAKQLQAAEPHLGNLQRLAAQTQRRVDAASAAFLARDEAFLRKSHYDVKVDFLAKCPDGMRSEGKLRRNQTKRLESEMAFQRAAEQAAAGAEEVVDRRWALTSALLSHVCAFYAALLQGGQHLAGAFRGMVGQLKAPHLWEPTADGDRKVVPAASGTGTPSKSCSGMLPSAVVAAGNAAGAPALALARCEASPRRSDVQLPLLKGGFSVSTSAGSTTGRSSSQPPSSWSRNRFGAVGGWSPATTVTPCRETHLEREDSTGSTGSWLRQNRA